MIALLQKYARPLELLLALIFGAGVVLKALDINLFAVQIAGYGVITDTAQLARTALAVLGVEAFLALLLLLGPSRRTLLYLGVQALLVAFTGLIAYGWAFHNLEDCGCFGPLEMSPALSISKNVVMMLLAGAAWLGFRQHSPIPGKRSDVPQKAVVSAIAAFGLVVGVSTTLEKLRPDEPRTFAQFTMATDFGYFDLGEGEYLVALLSAGCDHCKSEVPALNGLVYHPDLPPLLALCYEEYEGQIEEFRALTFPEFHLHSIGKRTLLFFDLLGDAQEPPRLVYIRDGAEVRAWNGETPDPSALAESLRESAAGQ